MFGGFDDPLIGPWKFFGPWASVDWSFMGWRSPNLSREYEHLEPEAWRSALLDVVEYMFWARSGDRVALINIICETNFHTRFRDMRMYSPFQKENLRTKRSLKRLAVDPFIGTVRKRGRCSFPDNCSTRKSVYFGEKDDAASVE